MRSSEQLDQLAPALAAAQGEMSVAIKNSINPHLRNKFAPLAECWRTLRDTFPKHGLSVLQAQSGDKMVTRILHSSGQWIEGDSEFIIHQQKGLSPMQCVGVAQTYSRRYGLAITGLVTDEDTDGSYQANPQTSDNSNYPSEPTPRRMETSQIAEDSAREPGALSPKQVSRLFDIKKQAGMSDRACGKLLKQHGIPVKGSLARMIAVIPWQKYEEICNAIESSGT